MPFDTPAFQYCRQVLSCFFKAHVRCVEFRRILVLFQYRAHAFSKHGTNQYVRVQHQPLAGAHRCLAARRDLNSATSSSSVMSLAASSASSCAAACFRSEEHTSE